MTLVKRDTVVSRSKQLFPAMLHTRHIHGPDSARLFVFKKLPSRVERPRFVTFWQQSPVRSSAAAEDYNRARTAAVHQVCLEEMEGPFHEPSVGG